MPAGGIRGLQLGSPLGSSPPASFDYELARFMQGNVQPRRNGSAKRGRRQGSAASPSASNLPVTHHFLQIKVRIARGGVTRCCMLLRRGCDRPHWQRRLACLA